MKKIYSLIFALLSLCQTGTAQVSACNRLCVDLSGCFQGKYCPGIYLGAEMGYAAIQAPKHGFLISSANPVKGDNGHFAYGLFAGFNGFTCFNKFYFGIDGGYHNNGYATLAFLGSKNQYQLESHDWGASATFTYSPLQSVDLFVKVGGANVTEKIRNTLLKDADRVLPKLSSSQWAPTIDTGVGYSIWNWLNLSVSYRGVFGRNQSDIACRMKFRTLEGERHYKWQGISTVHAVYGGLNVMF